MPLIQQQCLRHAGRPAVARCPSCGQSYCRECVVEHEHRLICAECLRQIIAAADSGKKRGGWFSLAPVAATAQLAAAFVLLWALFYAVGAALQRIPAEIHEGVIWTEEE